MHDSGIVCWYLWGGSASDKRQGATGGDFHPAWPPLPLTGDGRAPLAKVAGPGS